MLWKQVHLGNQECLQIQSAAVPSSNAPSAVCEQKGGHRVTFNLVLRLVSSSFGYWS